AGLPVIVNGAGPRLEGNVGDLQVGREVHAGVIEALGIRRKSGARVALPNALFAGQRTEVDAAIGKMRRGTRGAARAGAIATADTGVEVDVRLLRKGRREQEKADD